MEKLIPIIIQLLGGAAGGNAAAASMKNINISKVIATIAGIIGGVGGGQLASLTGILEKLGSEGGMDLGGIVGNIASSGIGGAILTAIVGLLMKGNKGAA